MDRSPAVVEVVVQVKPPIRESRLFEADPESNSELYNAVDAASQAWRVSCRAERETTQTGVKVPKYWLSAHEGCHGSETAGRLA